MSDIDKKEKLLFEFLMSSKELFVKCSGVVKPEYFKSPLNVAVKFVIKYYTKYHNIPDFDVVYAETDVKLKKHNVDQHDFDFVVDEIEKHCKEEAIMLSLIAGSDVVADATEKDEKVDFGKIDRLFRDALMLSIDKDMGVDYFADPEHRLELMKQHIDSRSIGWVGMDMVTDKCRRGELVVFAGNSASGKSVVLANVAANMAEQGMNTLVISLELGEDLISKRMDSIITGIDSAEIFNSIDDIVSILETNRKTYGSLFVKKMSTGTNSNEIRAYLVEYEIQYGYKPDCICIDYLDQLGTNEKSNDGIFEKDKQKSEELREIFQDFSVYGFTASQLNRESVDTEHKSQAHIAGGISKINTSDVVWGIIRNEEQQDNNEIHFQAMKLRNSEFSKNPVVLYWNSKTLKITDTHQVSKKPSPKTTANNKLKQMLGNKKNKKSKK